MRYKVFSMHYLGPGVALEFWLGWKEVKERLESSPCGGGHLLQEAVLISTPLPP